MPVTYYVLDNEFAASSGSNVNVTSRYSYFDHPPDSTNNLVITANKEDGDPSRFEVGDTYDITWTGHGGGSMEDAVIIRSDVIGPGQGAVVFEGINDTTGELYQVVWSPGFDLENWYWSNGGGPSSPNAFWTSDTDPGSTVDYVCFVRGTRIATPHGPRRVENIDRGDLVKTRDHGTQRVVWSGARKVLGKDRSAPVVFDPWAFGNSRRIALSPNHRILVTSCLAEQLFGVSEVFVPAKALVNNTNIRIEPRREVSYHHLLLADHEVLDAEGLACESLFVGKVAAECLNGDDTAACYSGLSDHTARGTMRTARHELTFREARRLAHRMGIVPLGPSRPEQPTLIPA